MRRNGIRRVASGLPFAEWQHESKTVTVDPLVDNPPSHSRINHVRFRVAGSEYRPHPTTL